MSCSDRERTGRLLHRTVVMTTVCCWVELPLFTCCQVAKEHLACSVNKSQPFPEQNMVLGQCAASKMKPGLASDLLQSVCHVSQASEGSGRTTAGRWRQSRDCQLPVEHIRPSRCARAPVCLVNLQATGNSPVLCFSHCNL